MLGSVVFPGWARAQTDVPGSRRNPGGSGFSSRGLSGRS